MKSGTIAKKAKGKSKIAVIDRVSYERDLKKELKNKKFKEGFEKKKVLLNLAIELSQERKNKHLSQRQLAKLADMKQQEIDRIEKGNQNVTVAPLSKLAHGSKKTLVVKFS